jgi:hypothetical protein
MVYISRTETPVVEPVVRRMLDSAFDEVRRVGGSLAAFLGLERGLPELLDLAQTSPDPATRAGAASTCALRLGHTTSPDAAGFTIRLLANDSEQAVRKAVGQVAGALRGQSVGSFRETLETLINSPSFQPALDQLLITLELAPDNVSDLVIRCVQRFIEVHGSEVGDLSTGAAGNARKVGRLTLRAYQQSRTSTERAAALDLIDNLLMFGAYQIDELVEGAER